MRILIVGDEQRLADFLEKGLREEGMVVDTAGDGERGLALARRVEHRGSARRRKARVRGQARRAPQRAACRCRNARRGDRKPESEAKLGLSVRPLTPELTREPGVEAEHGVVIDRIVPGTPAADSNLRPGDVIEEMNHRPIRTPEDLREAVSRRRSDQAAALWVQRGELGFYAVVEPSA